VLDCQIFWIIQAEPILTEVLTDVLLVLLYLGCTANQGSIPFGYLLHLLVQGHQGSILCFLESFECLPGMLKNCSSGVFIAEEAGVGDHNDRCTDNLGSHGDQSF
jgi:hypothetical protein